MAYVKGTWVDEVLAGSERYDIKEDGGAAFKSAMQIILSSTVVTAGTPITAAAMNNIENGIEALDKSAAYADNANIETLTDNKTLVDASPPIQILTPSGANRDVNFPADATTNHIFFVYNASATYYLVTKLSGGGVIKTLSPGMGAIYVPDGITWHCIAVRLIAATSAQINAGSDPYTFIHPDALAASIMGRKYMTIKVMDDTTVLTTGDGKIIVPIQPDFTGMNLISAHAAVSTVSSSGNPAITIERIRTGTGAGTVDMLSTAITIDASEKTSLTATTAPVINTSNDDVSMDATSQDQLSINIDTAGTGAKGLVVMLAFGLP